MASIRVVGRLGDEAAKIIELLDRLDEFDDGGAVFGVEERNQIDNRDRLAGEIRKQRDPHVEQAARADQPVEWGEDVVDLGEDRSHEFRDEGSDIQRYVLEGEERVAELRATEIERKIPVGDEVRLHGR